MLSIAKHTVNTFLFDDMKMIPYRLREARIAAQMTQENLGVEAGIDESTARSRISQYEKGTYTPNFLTICALAKVLNVPECYFYILDDVFAEKVLKLWHEP